MCKFMNNKFCYKIISVVAVILLLSVIAVRLEFNRIEKQKVIVAKVICAEACSEGAHVMMGVANTIHNRMLRKDKTAYEIVTEPKQYYGYTNKNREKIFSNKECQEVSLTLAKNINSLVDITAGALYFRVEGEPVKSWHKILTVKIGRVYFYR